MHNGSILMIDGAAVLELLDPAEGIKIVQQIYQLHETGSTVLPNSIFLRPDSTNRIIGLPGSISSPVNISGIKWVSSYPENYRKGIPRASSIIVLNDPDTGFPFCGINGTYINLFRTAASAYLAMQSLLKGKTINRLGIAGTGAIAGCFVDLFKYFGTVHTNTMLLFDRQTVRAQQFIEQKGIGNARIAASVAQLIRESDVIVFATTASEPYVAETGLFDHHPLVLHISLRDLSPEIILNSNNIVDDTSHANRENTSIHLAYKKVGKLDFINGSIAQLFDAGFPMDPNKATIFSPFGLGVLDIAIGKYIFDKACLQKKGTLISNFFNH